MLNLVQNYIYFYHLDKYCILPQFPEEIEDTMVAEFNQTTILGRSAPVFTYSNSGPRAVRFNFKLHRDMMNDTNIANNSFGITDDSIDDVLDELINTIEAAALPKYVNATKAVNPPVIALRIGDEIYIKGVIQGSVSKTFSGPIINNKYAVCSISFVVNEIDPYDAESVKTIGSFRGLNTSTEVGSLNSGGANG